MRRRIEARPAPGLVEDIRTGDRLRRRSRQAGRGVVRQFSSMRSSAARVAVAHGARRGGDPGARALWGAVRVLLAHLAAAASLDPSSG